MCLMSVWLNACASMGTVPTNLPDSALDTSNDVSFELSSLKGHVVLIDFWATWCKPCQFALPEYEKLHEEYSKAGLKIVAISVDHDKTALRRYLRKRPAPFPVLRDPKGRFAQVMGVLTMPTTFLIDRSGKIRAFFPGFSTQMLKRLKSRLKELLAEN